jgi:thiol-disulfide isomerase/thioredoxin
MKRTRDIALLAGAVYLAAAVALRDGGEHSMEAEDSYREALREVEASEPMRLAPLSPVPPATPEPNPQPAPAERLRVHETMDQATQASYASERPILIMFSAPLDECPKCRAILETTLQAESVIARINAGYEFVVVKGEAEPLLADQFGVKEYPTFAVAWPLEQRANKFLPPVEPAAFLEDVAFAAKKGR